MTNDVGLVEGPGELVEEKVCARVPVGLERDHHAPVEAPLSGVEGGFDLGGVMAIVVDNHHVAALATFPEGGVPRIGEAPLHAVEARKGLARGVERDFELVGDRDGRERVEHVVRPGHVHGECPEGLGAAERVEMSGRPLEARAAWRDSRLAWRCRRSRAVARCGQNLLHRGVVEAEHAEAIKGDGVCVLEKCRLDRVVRPVVVEVLGVDVRDDGDGRRQLQETTVALVGLRDEEVSLAQARVGAEGVDLASDDDRGSSPAARRMVATSEVVVVLPWEPAMVTA